MGSAVNRAFATTEILEKILIQVAEPQDPNGRGNHYNPGDVTGIQDMYTAMRVCHQFRSVSEGSVSLKQILSIGPISKERMQTRSTGCAINPLLLSSALTSAPYSFTFSLQSPRWRRPELLCRISHSNYRGFQIPIIKDHAEASWMHMRCATNAEILRFRTTFEASNVGDMLQHIRFHEISFTMDSDTTIGDLLDALREVRELATLRSRFAVGEVINGATIASFS